MEVQLGNITPHLNQRPKGGLLNDTVANPKSADHQFLAIMSCNYKVIKGVVSTPIAKESEKEVDVYEGAINVNNNNDVMENEGGETLGNRRSNEKEKVRGDAKNGKSSSPKNATSSLNIKAPQVKINLPFPQRLKEKGVDTKFQKFLPIFNYLSINVLLIEALTKIMRYTKMMKELVAKKTTLECEIIEVSYNCSTILMKHLVAKRDDPGAFTIP